MNKQDNNKSTIDMEKHNEKHKRVLRDKLFVWMTVVFGVALGLIIISSIVFFKQRIRKTEEFLSKDKINTYDKYYVMIANNMEEDIRNSIYESALKTAKENDAYVDLLGSNLDEEYRVEDLLKMAINMGVDGIILEGDNTEEVNELAKEANERNIPIVTICEDIADEENRKSYIGINKYELGREYGKQLCEYVAENKLNNCDVRVIFNETQMNSQDAIISGINSRIKDDQKDSIIKIESKIIENIVEYLAEEQINDMFIPHVENGKDGSGFKLPDVVVCLTEKNTICAYQAVVNSTNTDKVKVLGYYITPEIKEAISYNNIMSTVLIDTEEVGYDAVEALTELYLAGNVSDIYSVGTKTVTRENLATFDMEGVVVEEESK
ncbi:ribose transport system substrate-binding protein [Eubacterium uniforme]|uniref:Ribose transport system substrate-binding protein n=1 Tax=Eubacterium uniforme TaxID=39495 RepID=A0A1T4W4F0_9FIRM|nr:sugar ABC transporter substrate-binding protein [Eubacterium uniforme]SKA72019.1 ribose transport system substrate-binding protein [Eubacterium uniforme]